MTGASGRLFAVAVGAGPRGRVRQRGGYVTTMHAEAIGRASHALGAGRSRSASHRSWCWDHRDDQAGRCRERGRALLELHHRGGRNLEAALALCREAISIGESRRLPGRKYWARCDERRGRWTAA